MNTFTIESASGEGVLAFLERTPGDPDRPLERFKVRVEDLELSAVARVYVGDADVSPAEFFERMAAHERGWEGSFSWTSSDGELTLRGARDRAGHVAIRVALRSGPGANEWSVESTIWAEAGQLERLARDARAFFGEAAVNRGAGVQVG